MGLKIYNTLHRKKELFEPVESGKVRMYVCGPTVYNYISIGNARPIIVFNMVRNYLEYSGYEVNYVQNITDIEDKIINKAIEENVDFKVITRKYTDAFLYDVKSLKISKFDKMPKASEMIGEIINFIAKIIENGFGYATDGNVYFDVKKFKHYGKLSGQKIEEMKQQEVCVFSKRNKIDFALWKNAKEGEPYWDSPWGRGRPGWHIECSAMATKFLGHPIDIHGGGIDLVFPHHENEIAQSEAAFPKKGDFVHYWMHNGMIEIKEEKMSKSKGLKEDWILRNLLKKYSQNVVKIYMLTTHYRSPLEFSVEKLIEAKKALDKVTNTLRNIQFLIEESDKGCHTGETAEKKNAEAELKIDSLIKKCEEKFRHSMDDDFNSAKAAGSIFELIRNINSIIQSPKFVLTEAVKTSLDRAYKKINVLGSVLGFDFEKEVAKVAVDTETKIGLSSRDIERLIAEREKARKNKDFKLADEIRNKLSMGGVVLEDRKEGTIWKVIESSNGKKKL